MPETAVHLNAAAGATETTAAETTTPPTRTILDEKHENEIKTAVESSGGDNDGRKHENIISSNDAVDDDNERPNELVYDSNDHIDLGTTSKSEPENDIECSSCDHGCRMSYADDQKPNGRNECFCSTGFVLDANDGRTCHGK